MEYFDIDKQMIVAVGNPAHAIQLVLEMQGLVACSKILLVDHGEWALAANFLMPKKINMELLLDRTEELHCFETEYGGINVTTYCPYLLRELEDKLRAQDYKMVVINARQTASISAYEFAYPICDEESMDEFTLAYAHSRYKEQGLKNE